MKIPAVRRRYRWDERMGTLTELRAEQERLTKQAVELTEEDMQFVDEFPLDTDRIQEAWREFDISHIDFKYSPRGPFIVDAEQALQDICGKPVKFVECGACRGTGRIPASYTHNTTRRCLVCKGEGRRKLEEPPEELNPFSVMCDNLRPCIKKEIESFGKQTKNAKEDLEDLTESYDRWPHYGSYDWMPEDTAILTYPARVVPGTTRVTREPGGTYRVSAKVILPKAVVVKNIRDDNSGPVVFSQPLPVLFHT